MAVLCLGLAIGFQYHQDRLVAGIKSEHLKRAQHALASVQLNLQKNLQGLRGDLDLVSENLDLRSFSARPTAESLAKVRDFLENLSNARKGSYLQLRFIDLSGRERIRVDHVNGRAKPLADRELQDKSDRDYVIAGRQLVIDDYYLSALDLNIEHGKIVEPFVPTLRVVKVVPDEFGRPSGLVVINASAEELLDHMSHTTARDFSPTWIVNNGGHWMAGPNPDDNWGWLLPEKTPRRQSFAQKYGWAWRQLSDAKPNAALELQNGEFWGVAMVLQPANSAGLKAWSQVSSEVKSWYLLATPKVANPVAAWQKQVREEIGPYYLGTAFFGTILLLLLSRLRTLVQERAQSQRLMEERYHSALTNAPTGIILTDSQGDIELVNPVLAQLLGYSESSLIGMPVNRLLPGRKLNRLWLSQNPALSLADQDSVFDDPEQGTLKVQGRDGQVIPVEIVVSKADFSGRHGVIASVTDVSARIKAEADRDQLAERVRLSASAAGLGSFVEDLDAKTITANERTLELWGLALSQRDQAMPANTLWDQIHPSDRERFGEKLEFSPRINVRIQAFDGKVRHLQIDRQLTRGPSGERLRIGAVMDYTEEREQAQELMILQREQASILEAVPLGLGRCKNWKWSWVNPELAHWLGVQPSRLINQAVDQGFNHEKDRQHLRNEFDRCLRSGQSNLIVEFTMGSKGGNKQLRANVAILDPETESAIFAITDITHDKLHQQNLAAALKRAAAGEKAKANFVSMISHEIRTPLNGLLGTLQLLDGTRMNQEQSELLKVSLESGQMLRSLVDDVLDFSKQEAGKLELNPLPIRLANVLHRYDKLLATTPRNPGVSWQMHIDPALDIVVMADDFRLGQVVGNLVGNAFKFTLKGSVELEAKLGVQDERHVELKVDIKDTGIGMTPDVVDKLFTPFTQADSGQARKFGGSGLGLSISAGLIKQMGGEISVTSATGKGSTFSVRVRFPRASESGYEERNSSLTGSDFTNAGEVRSPLANKTVFVVDDNAVNRFVCRNMLIKHGAKVVEANDGAQSLAMLRDDGLDVDLVLMDLQMPVMDGFEAVGLLRNCGQSHLETLPIIALTGNVQSSDIEAVRAAGMQSHIAKPIVMDALIKQITEVLATNARI